MLYSYSSPTAPSNFVEFLLSSSTDRKAGMWSGEAACPVTDRLALISSKLLPWCSIVS